MKRISIAFLVAACGPSDPDLGTSREAVTTPSPIAVENARTGSSGWQITRSDQGIWAYPLTSASTRPGYTVRMAAAASTAQSATWELWRLGYYGGAGGRLIKSGGPLALPAVNPADARLDPDLGFVTAGWPETFRFTIPSTAVSGVFIVKLKTATQQVFSPIIVKERTDATVLAPILVILPINTWQAYNKWGGTSLYENDRDDWPLRYAHAVSWDRPYGMGQGTGFLVSQDLPFIRWAESRGYDLAYAADTDLDSLYTSLVLPRRALVFQGHDEYWTASMRSHTEGAMGHAINVAFLGANDCYWQARYQPDTSRRVLISYKRFADMDPYQETDPAHVTTEWRLPPVNRPENKMIGIMFGDWLDLGTFDLTVSDASSWVWAGAGVVNGTVIPGVYGIESDHQFSGGPTSLRIVGRGNVIDGDDGHADVAHTAWYTRSSGALVFAAGSIAWSQHLTDARIARATANVIERFAQ
jgi:N,N-dimethylformamidase beta subunit-like protein